ncbi:MAG: hypothetical protein R6U46_05550 [Marinilabilia sp.]
MLHFVRNDGDAVEFMDGVGSVFGEAENRPHPITLHADYQCHCERSEAIYYCLNKFPGQ